VVRHLNKMAGGSPLYRGGGSIGIIGAARCGLLIAADPDDPDSGRRILAVTKSNLAVLAPALAYQLTATQDGVAAVSWRGETAHTAASLLALPPDSDERSAIDDAATFLREALATGPLSAKDVQREAESAGISWASLRRAKAALHVDVSRVGEAGRRGGGAWQWSLPSGDLDAHAGDLGAQGAITCSTLSVEHLNRSNLEIPLRLEHLNPSDDLDAQGAHVGAGEHLNAAGGRCARCGGTLYRVSDAGVPACRTHWAEVA
jgi:hypothetical protein